MTESTINPSRIALRKVDAEHRLYLYLRTSPTQKQIEDIDGETTTLYEYDEEHIALPLPDVGVDLSDAANRLSDQATLKRQLRQAILDDDTLRSQLKAAIAEARAVDRRDNLNDYAGPPPVDLEPQHEWADARVLIVAPIDTSGIQTPIVGEYKKVIQVGNYNIWYVNAPIQTLVDLHEELWAMAPAGVLGALAAVGMMGESFLPWPVVDNTTLTKAEAANRRDRIADYLDGLGHDTTLLRQASNEHELVVGILDALDYAMEDLWDAIEQS